MIHALQVIDCFFPLTGAMSTNRLQICRYEAAAVSGLQIFYSVGHRIFSDGSDGQKLESRHLQSASEAKVCHYRDG